MRRGGWRILASLLLFLLTPVSEYAQDLQAVRRSLEQGHATAILVVEPMLFEDRPESVEFVSDWWAFFNGWRKSLPRTVQVFVLTTSQARQVLSGIPRQTTHVNYFFADDGTVLQCSDYILEPSEYDQARAWLVSMERPAGYCWTYPPKVTVRKVIRRGAAATGVSR